MARTPDNQPPGDAQARTARIAVIGTGWWATYAHLPALVRRRDVRVVALANRGADKLRTAAEAFNVADTYTDTNHTGLLFERYKCCDFSVNR